MFANCEESTAHVLHKVDFNISNLKRGKKRRVVGPRTTALRLIWVGFRQFQAQAVRE